MNMQHPVAASAEADPCNCMRCVTLRAAAEARHWSLIIARLEETMAESNATNAGIFALQDLDAARQGLEGLSSFLMALARQAEPATQLALEDVTASLGMRAQAARLAGVPVAAPLPDTLAEVWGDPAA